MNVDMARIHRYYAKTINNKRKRQLHLIKNKIICALYNIFNKVKWQPTDGENESQTYIWIYNPEYILKTLINQ